MFHLNTKWMMELLHDFKFSILIASILEHFLYGNYFACLGYCGLEYDSEGPITYDLFCVVC
jgi:hypothetical protein